MLKRERKAGGVEARAQVVVVTREEGEPEGREVLLLWLLLLLLLLLLLAVVGELESLKEDERGGQESVSPPEMEDTCEVRFNAYG